MTTRPMMRARLQEANHQRVAVEVEWPQGRRVLEYTARQPVWQAPPPGLDFAAVALVQFAASEGCDLHLEGRVTSDLLVSLDEYVMVWSVWRPDLFCRIELSADEEVAVELRPARRGAVMGFSGGVDAGFALAAHSTGRLGRLSRDIDLGVLVVGWDLRHGDEEALRLAEAKAKRALDAYGVGLAVVSTNWKDDFCNAWFMGFNAGLTAILHTFSGTHSAAIHATDRDYLDELGVLPYGSHMVINHLLGHPGFPVVSTGGTHNRTERVAFLADHPALLEDLRVCYQPHAGGGNCGHCEKCVRTQLEMRATGIPTDHVFPSPFTLDDIRSMRVRRWPLLVYFDNILERLSPDDEAYPVLRRWLREQKQQRTPQVRRLRDRVARLEQELVATRAEADAARDEVAALRGSTSWRLTTPLRRAADAARRVR